MIIPFSFNWAQLIGNSSGQNIYTGPQINIKKVVLNLNGFVGDRAGQIGFIDNGFNTFLVFTPPIVYAFSGFTPLFCAWNVNLIDMDGISINTSNFGLLYDDNGTGLLDPQNLVLSGSLTT